MSGQPAQPCSEVARSAGDPLAGTAPPARRWLLVEHPGPWGRAGYAGSGLAPGVVGALHRWAETTGGRVVLVRRPGRTGRQVDGTRRWFVADSRFDHVGLSGGTFDDQHDLIELAETAATDADADADTRSAPAGTGGPAVESLFLVCTHGRHDTCCAVHGRPLVAALADVHPDRVWECSHIGGCRFAPALVALPHGFVLGAVPGSKVLDVAGGYLRGLIDTRWLRGRSSLTPVEQAAQQAARDEIGTATLDALRPLTVTGDESEWRVELADPGCVVRLAERRVQLGRPLTCAMSTTGWQRVFDTVSVRRT